jgi:hypothetical protein
MEGPKMTVAEALGATLNLLGNISMPVGLREQVAAIGHAMDNIQLCLDAMANAEKEAKGDERNADAE